MLVVLVEEHRRGTLTLFPGTLVNMRDDEAMVLISDGVAVPAPRENQGRETR